jgi:hypothetical protein
MVTVFRSNASFTRRSVSSRIACFDISDLPVFGIEELLSYGDLRKHVLSFTYRYRHSTFAVKRRKFSVSMRPKRAFRETGRLLPPAVDKARRLQTALEFRGQAPAIEDLHGG